jgi:glycosyltransferase involved in cell wall biosynthesis
MTKVLFITHYLRPNGTENFIMNVYRNIDPTKFHIDFLLYTNEETCHTREVRQNGSIIYVVPGRKESLSGYYLGLRDFFKQHRGEYGAIHFCGGSLTSIAPLFFAWKYDVPVRIAHSHSSFTFGLHNKLLHYLNRIFIHKICTHYLACSDVAGEWFFGKHPFEIVKNGIDVEDFRFSEAIRNEERQKLNITHDSLVIGHAGRFSSEKNHEYLIDIFNEVRQINDKSILLLAGSGDLLEKTKKKVEHLGLSPYVHFLGQRHDVNRLMQAMDCFVMPSTFEGLPFVLVEAQCAGLPCYVSNNVSKDSALLPTTRFKSITSPAGIWAQDICKDGIDADRDKAADVVISKGYSINDIVKKLETIYTPGWK